MLCQRIFSSVFRAVFYTVKLHTLTQNVRGPLSIVTGQERDTNQTGRRYVVICEQDRKPTYSVKMWLVRVIFILPRLS